MGRKQIQKKFAIGFKEALLPPKLEALLASRFEKHFAAACSKNVVPDWKALLAFLRTCQHHYAMITLKTLLNSWCTSSRYNDNSADSCIFGCSHAKDDISHYSSCPHLWKISYLNSRTSFPDWTEQRLLFVEPSLERLEALVIAFTAYHAVKLGHPELRLQATRSHDFDGILALLRHVAQACAIKCGIGRVRFPRATALRVLDPPPSADEVDPHRAQAAAVEASVDDRPFCEPECNDLPTGAHHASCSQAVLTSTRLECHMSV